MDVQEALMTTRAIRRYTDEPVTDEEVNTCLRAAVQAPNGGNMQAWQFLIVRDADVKARLGEIYARSWGRYEGAVLKALGEPRTERGKEAREKMLKSSRYLAANIGQAPVLAAFLMPGASMSLSDEQGEMDTGHPYGSIFPAVQNFMLAARGLGVGTALTTVYRIHQNEVREVLAVPGHYEVVALVPMGRPKGSFGVAPRRPFEEVTHWDRFGNKRSAE